MDEAETRLPTVFLSHSHEDEKFVGAVEAHIIEGLCVTYKRSFDNGEHLIRAMEERVPRSTIFALFASHESLKSKWVSFEIDLARLEKLRRDDFAIYVFPVAPDIALSEFPNWMKQYWVPFQGRRPKDVARYLNHKLVDDLIRPQIFGRGRDVDGGVAKYLTQLADGASPNFFLISGLPQIGRYTFSRELLRRMFPQLRNLAVGPYIVLNEQAELLDFYRKLRDRIDEERSLEAVSEDMTAFRKLSPKEQIEETRKALEYFSKLDEAIFVSASGGLFDDTGQLRDWVRDLIREVAKYPRIRLIVTSNRDARSDAVADFPSVFQQKITQLEDEHVASLITYLCQRAGVSSPRLPKEILALIGGHPVFARYYARMIQQKGEMLAAARPGELIKLQESIVAHCVKPENLTQPQFDILQILSFLPRLDGRVMRAICCQELKVTEEEFHQDLEELVLSSLVNTNGDTYAMAGPIRGVFRRKLGAADSELLEAMSRVLETEWRGAKGLHDIRSELIDAFIYMHVIEGKKLPPELQRLVLPSTLLGMVRDTYQRARNEYDEEGYRRVVEWGMAALDLPMDEMTREQILGLVYRARVRLEDDEGAEALMKTLEQKGYRSRHSLKGFYHKKRREFSAAIAHFEAAWAMGIHDEALLHELCTCLHHCRKMDRIRQLLGAESSRIERNAYLLDLAIRIRMLERDFDPADAMIKKLRALPDDNGRSFKREAILQIVRKKDRQKARELLDHAIEANPQNPDLRSARCVLLCELKRADLAQTDCEIVEKKSRVGRQTAERLRVHLALAKNNIPLAQRLFDLLRGKAEADALLEARILEAVVSDLSRPLTEREKARNQAAHIRSKYQVLSDYDVI